MEEQDRPVIASLSGWQAALSSLILPGSGQFLLGRRQRGVVLLSFLVALAALIWWGGISFLALPLAALWLWNVWDAFQMVRGKEQGLIIPMLLGAVILYSLGIQATEFRLERLAGWRAITPYLSALADPEFMTYETEDLVARAPILVPCVAPLPEPDANRAPTVDPSVAFSAECAEVGDRLTVQGEGFFPEEPGELRWINPIGDVSRVVVEGEPVTFVADEEGRFSVEIVVPLAVPLTQQPGPGETQTHSLRAEQNVPFGSPVPTQTLLLVIEKIGETIALAFIATVMGLIFAVPLSFLAARNLMEANPLTRAVYYVTRTVLNVVRSIETLMWAIIFAVWVGLGPFAGSLALWLHTVAALGKLYSEAIESIDPGPIEALRATGANWPQMVVYAVLPQILPTFTSFTLFRWDINVRLSTVIGLVSDAGLGFLVIQWIRLNRFSSMATALIAIVLVIAGLDYLSSRIRQRIIEGTPAGQERSPLVRGLLRGAVALALILLFVWSWQTAEIDLEELVEGAPAGLRMAQAFAVPDLFDRPEETYTLSAPLPVPCGSGEGVSSGDAQVELSPACGPPGEELVITATDLPPETTVSVRWAFPDGGYLRIRSDCCTTDSAGNLRLETTITPLLEVGEEISEPGAVVITWDEVTGGLYLSDSFRTVVDLALVTLLMALMATTIGSFFAIPLSFFAARNIMGDTLAGRAVYYVFRTAFNILRSIEPLILVLIAAAWVGAGPFAGMLALAFNNVPNLGKLFSETIEEIDQGPVDAIKATGANRLQTLVFAIVPQLVPRFLAFILYQWDINIRMSTVIGFVGGGGIGQQFRLWIGLNQYAAAGMATWAIVAMVWSMDYLSARAREEMV